MGVQHTREWVAVQNNLEGEEYRKIKDPFLKNTQLSLFIAYLGCIAFDLTNHGVVHFVFWFVIALGLATARLSLVSTAEKRC